MVSYNVLQQLYSIIVFEPSIFKLQKWMFCPAGSIVFGNENLTEKPCGRMILIIISLFVTPTKYSMFLDIGGS